MSTQIAVIIWVALGIALKCLFFYLDPEYRKDSGRQFGPGRAGLQMMRRYPLREIGWYAYMAASFVVVFQVLAP